MKKIAKLLCFLLALTMALSVLSGCAGRKKGDPPIWTNEKTVVLTIGDYNVKYDFYRYLFLNTIRHFDNGDKSYWQKEGNNVKKVTDYVEESLMKTYATFALADKYDITLSEAELLEIETSIKQEKSNRGLSDKEFKKELEQQYMDEELYEFLVKTAHLEYKVMEHITDETSGIIKLDDQAIKKEIETNFARATHILFTFENEDEKRSQKELAEQVHKKLKDGEDFEKLKEAYSDDTDLKGNKDGYYFTHGEFKNAFEYTAFDLKENEISEVITSEIGFHIVKRLPIEKEYVEKNFEQLRRQCLIAKYYDMASEASSNMKKEYKEEYRSITLDTFN